LETLTLAPPVFVILSGCVPLLPTSTLPKPKADGATAICCEYAADGRMLRRAKIKRKGAQGLTKPKLVTVHTYAVRHGAQRWWCSFTPQIGPSKRQAGENCWWDSHWGGACSPDHGGTVLEGQGDTSRPSAISRARRVTWSGRAGGSLGSAVCPLLLKKFCPVVNEKLPHRPTASGIGESSGSAYLLSGTI
jgi:hypothetical protein